MQGGTAENGRRPCAVPNHPKAGLKDDSKTVSKDSDYGNAMAWVGHMSMLKAMAEEVVVRKVIDT